MSCQSRARDPSLRRADGAHRHRERAGVDAAPAAPGRSGVHRGAPPGGGDDRAHGVGARLGNDPRLRIDRDRAVHFDLRAIARARVDCPGADRATVKARQGVELITSGELRVVDEDMRDVPHDGKTLGEIVASGNVVMRGYYNDPRGDRGRFRRRMVSYGRRRGHPSGRLCRDSRSLQRCHHQRRREHFLDRSRGCPAAPPGGARGGCGRHTA